MRADTTASLSKHVVAARHFFFLFLPPFLPPSLFYSSCCDTLLHGERMYAKTIFWMYNERCAKGERGTDRGGPRGCGLSIPQKFHFHILHSRNTAIYNNNFSSARSDATRRAVSRVLARGGGSDGLHCRCARVRRADRIIFRVRRRGKRTNSLGDENKYARGGERGKTYFEINEQN